MPGRQVGRLEHEASMPLFFSICLMSPSRLSLSHEDVVPASPRLVEWVLDAFAGLPAPSVGVRKIAGCVGQTGERS